MSLRHEMADVLNLHWPMVLQSEKFNTWQLRTLNAIDKASSARSAHDEALVVLNRCWSETLNMGIVLEYLLEWSSGNGPV